MTKKKKSQKKYRNHNTPLHHQHKKVGTVLKSRMADLPTVPLEWEKELIPEFLWIDYLAQKFYNSKWFKIYDEFLDCLEKYIDTSKLYLRGTISDFGRIPKDSRKNILKEEKNVIRELFEEVIGGLLLLYPESPANWLLSREFTEECESNYEYELGRLKKSLFRLYEAKDEYCSNLRMMPFRRALKHQKIMFPRGMDTTDLLIKYPDGCNEDEKLQVQAFTRTSSNMLLTGMENPDMTHVSKAWCKYFWNHNYDISVCEKYTYSNKHEIDSKEKQILDKIPLACSEIAETILNYIEVINNKYKHHIFDSTNDEVVLGLFARISRFTNLLLSNMSFWPIDIARIMLRCITDSSINLVYLIHENRDPLFQSYINYGLGKEKLLMLHLQSQYQDATGPSGESFEQLQQNIGGGFAAELLDIELGAWSKTNTRRMSLKIGFDDLYRLVYDPASSDIHGSWTSIRNINLKRCVNPLHRFHRLADLSDPPIFIDHLKIAISIYERTVNKCIQLYNFPKFEGKMDSINQILFELMEIREGN